VIVAVALISVIPLLVWRDWLNLPLVPVSAAIALIGYLFAYLRARIRSRAHSEPAR
jgi:hypothetical protein